MWKIATSVTAIGLSLCMATAVVAKPGGGGGHPGGGGGHPGGGGGHPSFGGGHPGGGGPHFSGRAAPHFTAHASPHFSGGSHLATHGPSFRALSHGSVTRGSRFSHTPTPSSAHALATAGRNAGLVHNAAFAHHGLVNPGNFAARRQFAGNHAFAPFWHHGWHPYNHLGWIGPVFWPYAYGDFFYYALWPGDYDYVDPFWVYGYGDIYEGIFSPDLYDNYVQGPGAPARMKALTQQMGQSCTDEAAEVTGWPIDQIQAAVQPNDQQGALLDDLGNAVVKASDTIKSHCPTTVSFTPTGRLDDMQQRLQGMVQAVDIVGQPLTKFYDSLSDEQKARFNAMGPAQTGAAENRRPAPNAQASSAPNPQAGCGASVMAWPSEQIDHTVQPNEAQRTKLEALQSAAASAAETIKAACPSEMPTTPPSRLAAAGKHLQAMLQAVDTIRPPLHDFYNALSDDQKARFNSMGKQLFAENKP
jgi:hypothetical protein